MRRCEGDLGVVRHRGRDGATVADAALLVGALSGRALEPPPEPTTPRLGICLTHEWPAALPETGPSSTRFRGCSSGPELARRSRASRRLRRAGGGAEHDLDIRDRPLSGRRAPALPGADPGAAARDARRGGRDADRGVRRVAQAPRASVARRSLRSSTVSTRWLFRRRRVKRLTSPPQETRSSIGSGRRSARPRSPSPPEPAPGLPLGVQIVGLPGQDARILACAAWIERALGGAAQSTSPMAATQTSRSPSREPSERSLPPRELTLHPGRRLFEPVSSAASFAVRYSVTVTATRCTALFM